MHVDISALEEGLNRLELRGDAEALDLPPEDAVLEEPVVVDLRLEVLGENIRIDGKIRTAVLEECSRCLERFKRPVEAEIHLYAVREGAGGLEEAGEEEEGLIVHDGRRLDLRDEVRSAILLTAQLQPLCRADCKGLCPGCGENLNYGSCTCAAGRVDPRWKGLEKLSGGRD